MAARVLVAGIVFDLTAASDNGSSTIIYRNTRFGDSDRLFARSTLKNTFSSASYRRICTRALVIDRLRELLLARSEKRLFSSIVEFVKPSPIDVCSPFEVARRRAFTVCSRPGARLPELLSGGRLRRFWTWSGIATMRGENNLPDLRNYRNVFILCSKRR